MIIEKTNKDLSLDVSTLLGGTADIFGSYVAVADAYATDGSIFWRIDSSVYSAQGLIAEP